MEPTTGPFKYDEISPEEVNFYLRQAEKLRAEAVGDMFSALGRGIKGLFKAPAKLPAKADLPTKVVINRSDMVGAN